MSSIFGTIIALGMVVFACFLAIRSMIRDKKAGKSLSCGCDCKHCSGACHMCSPEEQARMQEHFLSITKKNQQI